MNLNTHQLQCILEIERTRSISQAAVNLYIAQPNLSRILKETEKELGFPIFERTRNGVYPTEKGKVFLLRAQSILNDTFFIKQIAENEQPLTSIRVCIPHSFYFSQQLSNHLASLDDTLPRDLTVEETDPISALESLESGKIDLAIIRFLPGYRNYFTNRAYELGFELLPLPDTHFRLVFRKDDSLASLESVDLQVLRERICISYPSEKMPTRSMAMQNSLQISDRLAQLQLLRKIPNTYSWMEPLPNAVLSGFDLVQRPCTNTQIIYQNAILFRQRKSHPEDLQRILQTICDACSAPFPGSSVSRS